MRAPRPAPPAFFDEPSDEDSGNGVTAFLDPLQDMTPPFASRADDDSAPLLPPAEPPDLLDLSSTDPQGDTHPTHPTFTDGSTIGSDSDGPDDPRVAAGESIALVLPDIPDPLFASRAIEARREGACARRPPGGRCEPVRGMLLRRGLRSGAPRGPRVPARDRR